MLPTRRVQFGEFLPDLDPLENPGCLEALNCIPEQGYYRQLNSLISYTDAITPTPHNGFWVQNSAGAIYTFLGTDDGLFLFDSVNNEWDDVSNAGFNPSGASRWQFERFGSRVIAVTPEFSPQYFDVDTPSTTFLDLPGSPPDASDIAAVRDFLFIAQPDGVRNRVQWSGFNSSEIWTSSLSTQSDFQDLQGNVGEVQRIVPGQYALIFCEHSIFRADYVGGNIIFQFNEIERGRGTPAPFSVVWTGELVFYYGHEGFFVHDGQRSRPIGVNRVDRYFRSTITPQNLSVMTGAIDRTNKLVFWAYRENSTTYNDRILIYNWGTDRWSRAEVDLFCFFQNKDPGYTLDALDALFPNGIDQQSILVDSIEFQGGSLQLGVMDSLKRSATFSGTALQAELITSEFSAFDRFYTDSIRPEVHSSAGVVQCAVGTRKVLSAAPVWSSDKTVENELGEAFIRTNARYQRYRLRISNGFTNVSGLTVRGRPAGRR